MITEENLMNAKEIMDENGYKTALIVSDPIHMKRAMYLSERVEIEGYASSTPTTMYQSFNTKVGFLCKEVIYNIGYQMVDLFGIEY